MDFIPFMSEKFFFFVGGAFSVCVGVVIFSLLILALNKDIILVTYSIIGYGIFLLGLSGYIKRGWEKEFIRSVT